MFSLLNSKGADPRHCKATGLEKLGIDNVEVFDTVFSESGESGIGGQTAQ